jgi:hypothetical protein
MVKVFPVFTVFFCIMLVSCDKDTTATTTCYIQNGVSHSCPPVVTPNQPLTNLCMGGTLPQGYLVIDDVFRIQDSSGKTCAASDGLDMNAWSIQPYAGLSQMTVCGDQPVGVEFPPNGWAISKEERVANRCTDTAQNPKPAVENVFTIFLLPQGQVGVQVCLTNAPPPGWCWTTKYFNTICGAEIESSPKTPNTADISASASCPPGERSR